MKYDNKTVPGHVDSMVRNHPTPTNPEPKFLSGKDSETLFAIALLQHDVFVTQKVLANYLKLKDNHEEVLKSFKSMSNETNTYTGLTTEDLDGGKQPWPQ